MMISLYYKSISVEIRQLLLLSKFSINQEKLLFAQIHLD